MTIPSANSSVSSQSTPVDVECTGNDETSNAPSCSKGHRNRRRLCSETVTGETQVELEKKHQHHHYHRHSHKHKHKHKHKRKDSKRPNMKHDKSKLCRDANHLNNDLDQSWSKHPFVDSSESGSHPVEVIVVSSDTSASPVSSTFQNGSTRNVVTKLQRKKSRSRSRSQSESRSVSKGKRIVQGDRCLRKRSGNSETCSGDRSCSVGEHAVYDGRRSRSP